MSKLLSLMLRHRPGEFGVTVDSQGFASLEAVMAALQKRDPRLALADVEAVVQRSEKQRFEILEGRIRARYGHSFKVDLGQAPAVPPEYLYKGVPGREVARVLSEGLAPLDRSYVHLSYDPGVAARLGRGENAVIRVDALKAHRAGVAFYDCGPTVLTLGVPPEFLSVERLSETRPRAAGPPPLQPGRARPEPQISEAYGRRRRFLR